ncbi:MipA/OmpV family protein [Aureimonas sp. AU20]|uniref:MipA/OmpV family protein n=1 Tax=Aureimonas sp. AU20 TaxID=1349819 RepID=UPI00071FF1D0|nr:MipA/OmpV family protein [Aureimonas sp. AU20]ALN71853.1 hypothetical protein M673_03950 [Aureimonas sp. AU20]
MSRFASNIRSLSCAATVLLLGSAPVAMPAAAADATLAERLAEPPVEDAATTPVRNWTLIVGLGGALKPEYEGGKDLEVSPLPIFLFTYGDWLKIDPTGLELEAFEANGFSVSALAGYESGRDEDDDPILRGLGDIDFAATLGGKVAYETGPFAIYATLEKTLGGSGGLVGTSGVSLTAPVSERIILGADAKAVFADDRHMQSYFGIDATQSARSGLPAYQAEAGLKRIDVSASATYLVNEHWLVRGEAGAKFLTGDAADSPIVRETVQPKASLMLGYKF